jgi:predicted neutral ceramidase superfamily lipid hydrolase
MDDINGRLRNIETSLHAIDKTLAINTEHLADHIRRTGIIEDELKPVVKHVEQMRGAGKLIALLALIATIMTVVLIFK